MNIKDAEICFHENNKQRGTGIKPSSLCSSGKASGLKTRGILLLLFVLVPAVLVASAAALGPIPNFSANITMGAAPLTVNFTDLSLTTPTAWAWYFGDENFNGTWTNQAPAGHWSARIRQSVVVTANGSMVLMGGSNGASVENNETWLSLPGINGFFGNTWTLVNASSGWPARESMSSVTLPDGRIVLIGGTNGTIVMNDTWMSTNNGTSWTSVSASPGWSARAALNTVALSDGSIVLTGGVDNLSAPNVAKNDTWSSTDNGVTWSLLNASSGWSPRYGHTSVALPDGSIVLMGGSGSNGTTFRNDTWKSTDKGGNWTLMNASSGWSARLMASSVAMPDGSIVLMGGLDQNQVLLNDTWRSTDSGAHWTRLNTSLGWSPRVYQSSVATPDGSIYVMGGADLANGPTQDVYRLLTAGSNGRNPTHVYTTNGLYQVALQVSNASGYNSTRVAGFVNVSNVTSAQTGANFSATPTSGTAPLTVAFTDLSTNGPTAWNWSFGDGNVTNATVRNPIHTYSAPGVYTVALNASNSTGFDIMTKVGYINVTNGTASKIGISLNGGWYIDVNGNGVWDGPTVDRFYTFGSPGVQAVTGDWNNDRITESGVFLNGGWYLDMNGSGIWDGPTVDRFYTFGSPGVQAVTGDWNHDGITESGVYLNGGWWLDFNGNGIWDGPTVDRFYTFGSASATPVTGDWNNDGITESGVYMNGGWWLDFNGNGVWDGPTVDRFYTFGSASATPVTGDWNNDRITESGVYMNGGWWLDFNGNGVWDGPTVDRFYTFGSPGWSPVSGKWG